MADRAVHERLADRESRVTSSTDRTFGLVFAVVLAGAGLLPLIRGRPLRPWPLVVAGLFAGAAWLRPSLLAPLNRVWTRLGLLLHAVTTTLVLGVVYYVAMTPLGWLRRALGHDPLRLRWDRTASTYWIERHPPGPSGDSMRNQF